MIKVCRGCCKENKENHSFCNVTWEIKPDDDVMRGEAERATVTVVPNDCLAVGIK